MFAEMATASLSAPNADGTKVSNARLRLAPRAPRMLLRRVLPISGYRSLHRLRNSMLRGLLRRRRPDLNGMGNQLLIDLHGVDDDLVSDFDVGLLNRLLGAFVGGHLRVKAHLDGFTGRRFYRNGRVRNLGHDAGHVLFAAVSNGESW